MKLTKSHQHILQALFNGATLKAHRYLDGSKIYQLHPLAGPAEIVSRASVDYLKAHKLIESNKKFPAATYLLTSKGKNVAGELKSQDI
jgi:hypothetical protein